MGVRGTQTCSTHHTVKQWGSWEAPVWAVISISRHPRPRVSRCEQPASCLRRAIGRRITSSPPRDRSRTRWRISGGWCGSGSATPLLCSRKFRRGSRYVSYSGWLQSRAGNAGEISALMLNYLLPPSSSDRRFFFFFPFPTAGTCFCIWCGPVLLLVCELLEKPPRPLKIMVCKRAQFSLKAQNL